VIHNPRIRYSENNDIKDAYFSMSGTDLIELAKAIDRALAKETALPNLLKIVNPNIVMKGLHGS
jgi:hypothetical protein